MSYWREWLPLKLWQFHVDGRCLILSWSRAMPSNTRFWHVLLRLPDLGSPFWRGFRAVLMYAGAYLCLAPMWMRDWDRPMKRLLSLSK